MRQWRRRMTWFHRARKGEQAEEKPEPVLAYYDPHVSDILNGTWEDGRPIHFNARQSETTSYFEIDLVDKLQAKKDTDESK